MLIWEGEKVITSRLLCFAQFFIDSSTWSNLQKKFEHVSDSDELCDVYDGREYRKHLNFFSKPENVSLLLNTDGVSVFRLSTVSLWPLWLVINELPPSVRFVHTYTHANTCAHICTHTHTHTSKHTLTGSAIKNICLQVQ